MTECLAPPRFETNAAVDTLDSMLTLGISDYGPDVQDWHLLAVDAHRLNEFCNLYAHGKLDSDIKFALMMLIIASLDDALCDPMLKTSIENLTQRVMCLLRDDFFLHFHTIHYWSLLDEPDLENVFSVTPHIRTVWYECFTEDHARWIAPD